MTPADFDLKLLVALRALLEEASVTRAGQRIQLGQSSMSSALAKLRSRFQDELLVRVGRDYELTPLARELLPQVQRTLAEIERALDAEGPFDPATCRRRFTFRCSDHTAIELRELLTPLLDRAPGMSFEFRTLPEGSAYSERDLLAHDFVVATSDTPIEGESRALFADVYVCLLDADNPAVVDGELSWEAFVSLRHAVAGSQAAPTPAVRRLRELGLRHEPVVKAAGLLPLASIVAGTDLVAVVPSRLAARLGPATGTIAVPAPFPATEIVETMWWHASRELDPAHAWLREQLVAGSGGLQRAELHDLGCS
ncbi:LysR family transcriptional regulator [Nocardioides sp.]|uniref:LysR family transcriptional regulator n=1 Tax=Nocardioides sp. TaxID=35761 RepID=UPI0039E60715